LAGYSGYLLWDIFLGLDSYHYPVRSFGDLGYRLFGNWMRYIFNFLQAIQLLLNVGLIIISNGEALSQAAKFNLCFAICCLIWALVGFVVGQIRTLQKFGWLANVAVWLNLICMFITMGAAAHSPPNYAGVTQSAGQVIDGGALVTPDADGNFPAVQTSGGLPDTGGFIGAVSGAMQAIFAYGGAMIFPEFMAEMKRPKDFLTAMWAAQAFIYFWYVKRHSNSHRPCGDIVGLTVAAGICSTACSCTDTKVSTPSIRAISGLGRMVSRRPATSSPWSVP
jgi:hypothetical protein